MAHTQTMSAPAGEAAQRVAWSPGRPHWIAARLRAIIFAAAGISLVLTGCTVNATGRGAAGPDLGRWQAPPVLPQQLAGLLLSPGDVNSVGHSATMTLRMPTAEMSHTESVLSDPQCLDAYSPIQADVYHGSNWVAVQGQLLDDAPSEAGPKNHAVLQAVVGFRDADSAQQFLTQAKPRWSACANRPMTVNRPGRTAVTYDFGALRTTETSLSMIQIMHGGSGVACQRAIGLANNVIVDTLWCGFDTTDQASQVITKIAAAATQA